MCSTIRLPSGPNFSTNLKKTDTRELWGILLVLKACPLTGCGRGGAEGWLRSPIVVRNCRKILCLFPAYTPAFGTFAHAFPLLYKVHAFMPPQGLLLIAAYLPDSWEVRFIDENMARAAPADFAWADAIMVSGMHVQAPQIRDIAERAHAAGKVVALGGPSVSAAPEMYPDIDYLHIGEIGDATDGLISSLMGIFRVPQRSAGYERRTVCRSNNFRYRPMALSRSAAISSAASSSPAGVRIAASSATFPASTVVSPG